MKKYHGGWEGNNMGCNDNGWDTTIEGGCRNKDGTLAGGRQLLSGDIVIGMGQRPERYDDIVIGMGQRPERYDGIVIGYRPLELWWHCYRDRAENLEVWGHWVGTENLEVWRHCYREGAENLEVWRHCYREEAENLEVWRRCSHSYRNGQTGRYDEELYCYNSSTQDQIVKKMNL